MVRLCLWLRATSHRSTGGKSGQYAFREEADSAYQQVEDAYRNGKRLAQQRPESCLVGHAMDSSELLLEL